MIRLIPIYQWFYGKDIIIDSLSFLIVLLILFYSIKFYRMNRSQKKYLYLISSFLLLSLSFLAKLMSHFIIYYTAVETKKIGIISLTYQTINSSGLFVFWGILIYRILSLFAIYLFYLIYSDKLDVMNQALMIYLLMLVAYLGHSEFYLFHLTYSMLLLFIIISIYSRYSKKKSISTKRLVNGFELLLLSQLVFIFIFAGNPLYLIGEIIQLLGYVLIVLGFIKVLGSGKKKG